MFFFETWYFLSEVGIHFFFYIFLVLFVDEKKSFAISFNSVSIKT